MNELVTSDEQFIAARDFLRTSISALLPDLDFRNGSALNDLVITPAAKLAAEERIREDNYYKTYNPANVTADTPVEVVNAILSRYFIDPAVGNKATGVVKILTNASVTQIVPADTELTAGGLVFKTTATVRAVASKNLVKTTNDVVYQEANSGYFFLVPVVAADIGATYNIARGTVFEVPVSYTAITAITANSDFSGGSNSETPMEALGRIPERFGARTTGMASSLTKLVYDQFGISSAVAVYSPDSALMRAARNSIGLPMGGFCDLYVRSAVRAEKLVVPLSAILTDPVTSTWSITLPDQYFGAYAVKVGAVVATVKSTLVSPSDQNTIVNWQDSVYSSRQASEYTFTSAESASALTVGTEKVFSVEITRMPLVADISAYLADAARKSGVDLLVRGVSPVFVTVSFSILRKSSDPVPDVAKLKSAIVAAVDELGTGINNLDGSVIIGVVQPKLGQRSFVQTDSFTLEARVFDHKLETSSIVGAKSILVAERPEDGITKDTIGFIIREEDININVMDYQ
jgi:hypothetical protein